MWHTRFPSGRHFDALLKYPGNYLWLGRSAKSSFLVTLREHYIAAMVRFMRGTLGFVNEQRESLAHRTVLIRQAQPIRQNKRNG